MAIGRGTRVLERYAVAAQCQGVVSGHLGPCPPSVQLVTVGYPSPFGPRDRRRPGRFR